MIRLILYSAMSLLMIDAMVETGGAQIVQASFPVSPTSPQSYWQPQLPQPPTPAGPVPNVVTSPWPFEVLPYYYQSPVYESSPYSRYLQSYQWNAPSQITPLPYTYIPSFSIPPQQEWPYYLPLH
jgi:hypothetical protein